MNIRKKTKINSKRIDRNIKMVKKYCNNSDYIEMTLEHDNKTTSKKFNKHTFLKKMLILRKLLNNDIRQKYSNHGQTRKRF